MWHVDGNINKKILGVKGPTVYDIYVDFRMADWLILALWALPGKLSILLQCNFSEYLHVQVFLSERSSIPVGHSHLGPDGLYKHK